MEINKQTQQAGDGSNQVQIVSATINMGISEERVRAIVEEQIQYALAKLSEEARAIGRERNKQFEKRVISRISRIENGLLSFSDPATQILLRHAQLSAAATEREEDYDMLTELLACHVQKGKDRKNRAAIHQAVQIVDKIDNNALCGLTIAHAFSFYSPTSTTCEEGLKVLDNLFEKIMYQELPSDDSWLDHLDVLGAIRIVSLGKLKGILEFYKKSLSGYICAGIKKDSEDYGKAVLMLEAVGLDRNGLIDNECLSGFVRIPVRDEQSIDDLHYIRGTVRSPLNQDQKNVFKQIWKMYSQDSSLQKQVEDAFLEKWDRFESLRKFRQWWESIPRAFEITSVGRVLAQTNSKRCDPALPDLI